MAEAQYLTEFRYAADIDAEEYWRPWQEAVPQIKALIGLCVLSAVVAVGYPEYFAEVFGRL
jgi:hypothetical protein